MDTALQNAIKKMQEANRIRNEAFHELIPFEDLIKACAIRYIKAYSLPCNYSSCPSSKADIYIKGINDMEVNLSWDETWSYGGHDCGSFQLPLVYLNEDNLAEYERDQFLLAKKKEEEEKENSLIRKQEEISRLEKELAEMKTKL